MSASSLAGVFLREMLAWALQERRPRRGRRSGSRSLVVPVDPGAILAHPLWRTLAAPTPFAHELVQEVLEGSRIEVPTELVAAVLEADAADPTGSWVAGAVGVSRAAALEIDSRRHVLVGLTPLQVFERAWIRLAKVYWPNLSTPGTEGQDTSQKSRP